jgi:DNA-binding protein
MDLKLLKANTAVDKLQYSIGNSASTTLAGSMTNSDTTATLTSDTNFAAKSGAGMILLDEGQATEELAYSTGKTGAVLAVPLANRGLEGGSAQTHSSAASVKGIFSAGMWNNVIDALSLVVSKTTGLINKATGAEVTTGTDDAKIVTAKAISDAGLNVSASSTTTFTNKRITKRVTTITSSATPTVNTDNCDCVTITALAAAITSMTSNLSGTPTNFQTLVYRIKDDGTARAITWGASFEAKGVALPTTTVISPYSRIYLRYSDFKMGMLSLSSGGLIWHNQL